MMRWLKRTMILLGVVLLSEESIAEKEDKLSEENNKYGYSINLGNRENFNDDFEWYMPLHIGPQENWSDPKKEADTSFRSLKAGKVGLVYAKPLPADKVMTPSFIEIKYKNTAKRPIGLKIYSGTGSNDGYETFKELEDGKNNNEWTTECFEVPQRKMKINDDGFYVFAIDLRDINVELPVSELKVFIKAEGKILPEGENARFGFEDELSWNLVCYPLKVKDYESRLDKEVFRSSKSSLMIKCMKKDETTSWGGAFYDIKVKGEANYKLTVYAKAQDISGALLMCYYNGVKPKTLDAYHFDNGTYDWRKYEFKLRIPKDSKSVRCYFRVGGKGTIWFDDVKIEEIPDEKCQLFTHNGKSYLYDARTEKNDPALSENILKKYSSRACVPYIRKNLRGFYPDSVPQPDEVKDAVNIFACPGQYAAGWLMVYGLEDIKDLSVNVANDLSYKNETIKKEGFQVKYIKFWKAPWNDEYNSWRYFIVPELLVKNRIVDVAKNTNAGFWIQLKVPAQAVSGNYTSRIQVQSGNKLLAEIPLNIEILPFVLEQPEGINWIVHSADLLERYRDKSHEYTDGELCRYLSDMRDYGITGIFEAPYGNLDYTRRTAHLFKKTGFNGPLIIHSFLEEKAKAKHNIKSKTRSVFPEMQDTAFHDEVVNDIKEVDAIIKKEGVKEWYYHAFGEVNDYQPDWIKHAVFISQMATRAGIKLYTTLYPVEIIKQIFPYMNGGINTSGFFASNPEKNSIYHKLAKEHNISLYNLSGIYTGQTGGMMPNRYFAGFLLYKAGAQGHVTWTYQRVGSKGGPNPWGRKCMAYPACEISEKEVSISTLQWEGVREGIEDYKYLYTLTQWINRAKENGFIREAVETQKKLDKMVKTMPWGNDFEFGNSYLKPGNFTDDDAMQCRREISKMIIELKNYIEKEKTMFPAYKDIQTNPGIGERGMIDIYLPGNKVPYPFILGIHGGGWCGGDRTSYRHFWPRVRAAGFAFALCSYRLAPEFHYPNQYNDLINVLKWLKENGSKYGLDTNRCALLGGSAGGHMLMLSGLRATKEIPGEIVKIKALINYCGVMNVKDQYFYDATVRHSKMTSNFIGGTPEEQDDKYREASPINHVHKQAPPVWMAHGEKDNVVPIGQSEKMAAALKENGVECVFMKAPGRGHTLTKEDDFRIGDVQFLYEKEMFDFLKEKLK